ncbi:cytochrome c oxidase assembly protein COX18, mitochondrial-like isoform X2 [Homarus americanus]|uniref:cytochrome c oxidase assembly protein COX18, mitochondrial-like isoform X2 n=1 Tax=Homarus americanus TaxID=6706 RepID=UPI001C439D39|nr:cytochrome c oxidase assembly protein COX18, mitochondrial-like isoform X2 [Homarus americanus]
MEKTISTRRTRILDQNYVMAKLENLKPEMDELVQELKKETAYAAKRFGWDEKQARLMFNQSARKIWKELIIRDNCHPFKTSILLWVQIPLWIAMSMSFRNMASMMPHQDAAAQVLFMELSTGGFGWIPNLTEVDHSLILPVAMGITNLIITEVNVLSRHQEGSKLQNIATNVFRVISIAVIPIAATVPSCVTLYWFTSSMCGLAQNLAMMHPGLRQLCGIPQSPIQRENPYQHLWTQLQKKMTKKRKKDGKN